MTDEVKTNEIPPYDQSGIQCPECKAELPKSLFMRYIKSSFIRYFLFMFCLSFTLVTVIIDIRTHYSTDQTRTSTFLNPYQIALIFSGAFALIGWLSQKQNDLRKEIKKKGVIKPNAQS